MRSLFTQVFGGFAVLLFSTIAFAQGAPEIPEPAPLPGEKTEIEKYLDGIGKSRNEISREDRVLKKGLLAPSEADRLLFADFLHQRNTGLIRLLPREVYDSKSKSDQTANAAQIRGGGSYYSFANLTHAYGFGSDIGLEHNYFSVGFAGASYGMITNLGDAFLEQITLTDARAQFLSSYEPPALEPEARAEARRFGARDGVMTDGLLYQRRVPVEENTSYLLRSIDYDRTDVLVALRVVRKDPDDSLIIAWKLLKSFPPTKLKHGK
jgi:hypothetical protein